MYFCFLETEGRHAMAKAEEAVDHLASFMSSREEISRPGIETADLFLEIWVSPHQHLEV